MPDEDDQHRPEVPQQGGQAHKGRLEGGGLIQGQSGAEAGKSPEREGPASLCVHRIQTEESDHPP